MAAAEGSEAVSKPETTASSASSADSSSASSAASSSAAADDAASAEIVASALAGSMASALRLPVVDSDLDDERSLSASRCSRFTRCLGEARVDVGRLRTLAWAGVPHRFRAVTWQCLLGYRPLENAAAAAMLEKRRREYADDVRRHLKSKTGVYRTEPEQRLLRQVLVDVPRTLPSIALVHAAPVQRALERLLFLWAVRHPASGYVQGMNDIAALLFVVFLAPFAGCKSKVAEGATKAVLAAVEADVFHCLARLLDGIQDHYTPDQPGIQRVIHNVGELLVRIDAPLAAHVEAQGFSLMQLIFPWINCLLLRELPLPVALRLWDTYFAEGGGEGGSGAGAAGFEEFHTYVCAAILAHFSEEMRAREKTDLVEFVQSIPTRSWRVRDVESVLSQAYIFKSTFGGAKGHLE